MEIGQRIRERRDALSLTQERLADEIGVTSQYVSRLETGQNVPSADLIVRLSRALGVTTDYLLTGDDRPAVDLRGAIRGESGLSSRAKDALIRLVEELRKE